MGDRERWEELYAAGARPDRPPSGWILETVAALPNALPLLDVAGGSGRHAVPLARVGRRVVLADFSPTAVLAAVRREPQLAGVVADAARLPFRAGRFGVVLVANFLDRDIFGDLGALLTPGGFLVYETYTLAHLDLVQQGMARGPTSAAFLLEQGELPRLARDLDILQAVEGEVNDAAGRRHVARLLARRRP